MFAPSCTVFVKGNICWCINCCACRDKLFQTPKLGLEVGRRIYVDTIMHILELASGSHLSFVRTLDFRAGYCE
jgi:hypothetical protein